MTSIRSPRVPHPPPASIVGNEANRSGGMHTGGARSTWSSADAQKGFADGSSSNREFHVLDTANNTLSPRHQRVDSGRVVHTSPVSSGFCATLSCATLSCARHALNLACIFLILHLPTNSPSLALFHFPPHCLLAVFCGVVSIGTP